MTEDFRWVEGSGTCWCRNPATGVLILGGRTFGPYCSRHAEEQKSRARKHVALRESDSDLKSGQTGG